MHLYAATTAWSVVSFYLIWLGYTSLAVWVVALLIGAGLAMALVWRILGSASRIRAIRSKRIW